MNNHQTRPSVAISRRTMLKALGAGTAVVPLAGRVPAAAAADPIKIGLSAAFSGPNASAGEAMQRPTVTRTRGFRGQKMVGRGGVHFLKPVILSLSKDR